MGLTGNVIVEVLLRDRVRISASVLSIVRDVHTTDDVFQQVVLQALEGHELFREPGHLLAWALRAARRRALDLVRKRGARTLDEGVLEQLEQLWTASSGGEAASRMEALQQCLKKLPARARELVRLRYEDGLSCGTVARRVDRSLDAIYQSLSRIHRQLRECIDRQLGSSAQPSLGETS